MKNSRLTSSLLLSSSLLLIISYSTVVLGAGATITLKPDAAKTTVITTNTDIDDCRRDGDKSPSTLVQQQRKHKHIILLMGGIKTLAAVVLIKIKIVLAMAVLVAVVVYTVKYLLGNTGLPFVNKGQILASQLPYHHHLQQQQHHQLATEVIDGPETLYSGYGYQNSIPWDHTSHEGQTNSWSKIGDGGRSMPDTQSSSHQQYKQILPRNFFKHRRKRKRNINLINMYS